MNINQMEY